MGDPACAGCGRTKARIDRDNADLEKRGVMVFRNPSGPLLYCDQCRKHFCGRCLLEDGWNAVCPECKKVVG